MSGRKSKVLQAFEKIQYILMLNREGQHKYLINSMYSKHDIKEIKNQESISLFGNTVSWCQDIACFVYAPDYEPYIETKNHVSFFMSVKDEFGNDNMQEFQTMLKHFGIGIDVVDTLKKDQKMVVIADHDYDQKSRFILTEDNDLWSAACKVGLACELWGPHIEDIRKR